MKKLTIITIASYLVLSSCGSSNNEPTAPAAPEQSAAQNQPETAPEPETKKTTPKINKTNEYAGTYADMEIDGTLTFESDKTVKGIFYNLYDSSDSYRVRGTNYVDGEVEVTVTDNDGRAFGGTLTKTLTKTHIIWEGDLWLVDGYGERTYLQIRRLR